LDAPAGAPPRLRPVPDSRTHYVSLSHTRTAAVAAIGPQAIGVDVESAHRRVNWSRIADACFSADEQTWLDQHPPDQRKTAFLVLWTGKEAWLKAQGLGLAHLDKALFEPLKPYPSFPRRQEPSVFASTTQKRHWIPACAGMTGQAGAAPGDPCWRVP